MITGGIGAGSVIFFAGDASERIVKGFGGLSFGIDLLLHAAKLIVNGAVDLARGQGLAGRALEGIKSEGCLPPFGVGHRSNIPISIIVVTVGRLYGCVAFRIRNGRQSDECQMSSGIVLELAGTILGIGLADGPAFCGVGGGGGRTIRVNGPREAARRIAQVMDFTPLRVAHHGVMPGRVIFQLDTISQRVNHGSPAPGGIVLILRDLPFGIGARNHSTAGVINHDHRRNDAVGRNEGRFISGDRAGGYRRDRDEDVGVAVEFDDLAGDVIYRASGKRPEAWPVAIHRQHHAAILVENVLVHRTIRIASLNQIAHEIV